MTTDERIIRIARQSLQLQVTPDRTPAWMADPAFGINYAADIWEGRAALRDSRAPVFIVDKRGGGKRLKPPPAVTPEDQDDDDQRGPTDDHDDESDPRVDDEAEGDEGDVTDTECLCTCSACERGDCLSCAYRGDAECEDPGCGCREDDETGDDRDDE